MPFFLLCAKLIVHSIQFYFFQDFLGCAPIYAQVFQRPLSFSLPHQKPVSISRLPIPTTIPSLIAFSHEDPYYAVSYYFFHLRSKHPPQPQSSNIPSLCSSLNKRPRFTRTQNNRQNCGSANFNLYIVIRQTKGHLNDVITHANRSILQQHVVTRTPHSPVVLSRTLCALASLRLFSGPIAAMTLTSTSVGTARSLIGSLVCRGRLYAIVVTPFFRSPDTSTASLRPPILSSGHTPFLPSHCQQICTPTVTS